MEEAHIPLLPQLTHLQPGHQHLPQHFVSGAPAGPTWGLSVEDPGPDGGEEEEAGN